MEKKNLFAVFDVSHKMVAWEVAIGRVLAQPATCELTGQQIPIPSLWAYSNLSEKAKGYELDLMSELQMEMIRQRHFPSTQSRLSGAFFFESLADAEKACADWEWDPDNISEVEFYTDNYLKADSEWITKRIRVVERGERNEYIKKYFSGEALDEERAIPELICSGFGFIKNKALRRRAYNNVLSKDPNSSLLLAFAIAAFDQNKEKYRDLLRLVPFIKDSNDGFIEGLFAIEMSMLKRHEPEIASISRRYIHNRGTTLSIPSLTRPGIPLRIQRPADENTIFALGDLSDQFFKIKKSEFEELLSIVSN